MKRVFYVRRGSGRPREVQFAWTVQPTPRHRLGWAELWTVPVMSGILDQEVGPVFSVKWASTRIRLAIGRAALVRLTRRLDWQV
jgi:hypothetical protein